MQSIEVVVRNRPVGSGAVFYHEPSIVRYVGELMDNPNWPLQAARALGVKEPLDLVHAREAQRLRLREQHRKDYPPGMAIEIPFGPNDVVPYSWEDLSPGKRARH